MTKFHSNPWMKCPYCRSTNIEKGDMLEKTDGIEIQDAECLHCWKKFYVYHYSDGEYRVIGREQDD